MGYCKDHDWNTNDDQPCPVCGKKEEKKSGRLGSLFKFAPPTREKAKEKVASFVKEKGKVNVKKKSSFMRTNICALMPEMEKKFEKADASCKKVFGRPLKIEPKPKEIGSPISYRDGIIYLDPECSPAKLLGGIVFELNNALHCEVFKEIDEDYKNEFKDSDPKEYGIDDPWAIEYFAKLETPAEKKAFAQEYIEWKHMTQTTMKEQEKLAKALDVKDKALEDITYLKTDKDNEGARNGTWSTFKGYFNDEKGGQIHYTGVLHATRSEEVKKMTPEQLVKAYLKRLRIQVPEEYLSDTIKRMLKLGAKKEKESENYKLDLFIAGQVRQFTNAERDFSPVEERDFDVEKWKGWMKG